ncbi:histidine kinase [Dactylosporangium sucinum]|uniref:histidine kinase n=1 Tax=Dactylosporangium sucinum TaxID=1424081 RepID=A0A917U613_9ACTN|nr:histidine kinase [Dactylosporangium sucinum]GGM61365.1 two-component sensor histidine kinase [Dactylosporangium sucinum]
MRGTLRHLRAFLVGPDPAVHPRTRLGRSLPLIAAVAAVLSGLLSYEYLRGNGGGSGFYRAVVSILTAAPLALLPTRPLLAWRFAWVVALWTGLTLDLRDGTPWPWQPVQILLFPLILAVVAIRHPRGVLVWVGASALVLLLGFTNPNNVAGLVLAVLAIIVVGDQIRRRREVQRALAEEEERTELAQARRAVAEERNRIAREMHDVVAHHMSLIAVRAETAVYRIEGVPPAVAEELAAIASTSREALGEMRRLLGVLRGADQPAPTEPQPVLDDLAGLVRDAREAGVEVTFVPLPGAEVPPAVGLAAYRIVQEALSNARRHAAGAPVRIALTRDRGALRVRVHNRPGVAEDGGGAGHGLLGMRERAAAAGGSLTAGPVADGYLVEALLPLDHDGNGDGTD